MPDMRTYQNEHNMLLNFPRYLSILLLQTSKTDNNAPALTLFITSNLEKHNLIQQTLYYQIKCIMPKQRECIYFHCKPAEPLLKKLMKLH
jgi:hypothetical protein